MITSRFRCYAWLVSLGNFYGTTYTGGDLNECDGYGCGVVFELTP
ncbi:MAG TPA: hypothetical protein VMI10_12200 [Terriglobales bacterium]|nr:hypothetical protein [Terriglobales bacterium]